MPGNIDTIDNHGMSGWACTRERAGPSPIRVDVNGVFRHRFLPRKYRPDLADAGFAAGYCSLTVIFSSPLTRTEPVVVEVWNEDTGELLTKPGLSIGPLPAETGSDWRGLSVAPAARSEAGAEPVEFSAFCGGRSAPRLVAGSADAALAHISRTAMERISALLQEVDGLRSEIIRLRSELADQTKSCGSLPASAGISD